MNVSFMISGPALPPYVINDVDPNITIQELKPKILQRLKLESNLNITPQNSIQKIFLKGKELTNTETLKSISYSSELRLFVFLNQPIQVVIIPTTAQLVSQPAIEPIPDYRANDPSQSVWGSRIIGYRHLDTSRRYPIVSQDKIEINPLVEPYKRGGSSRGGRRRNRSNARKNSRRQKRKTARRSRRGGSRRV